MTKKIGKVITINAPLTGAMIGTKIDGFEESGIYK